VIAFGSGRQDNILSGIEVHTLTLRRRTSSKFKTSKSVTFIVLSPLKCINIIVTRKNFGYNRSIYVYRRMVMGSRPDFSYVAKLMADPSRAAMLDALMGLDGLPATELARKANVTIQTASGHLSRLVEGKLIHVEKHGRHRYFRLANTDVARAIEALTFIAPPAHIKSLKNSSRAKKIKIARTCYDHLAGKLGVALTDAFIDNGYIIEEQNDFTVTDKGEKYFHDFEINLDSLRKERRHFT